jgi:hypothetical protein
VSEGQKDDGAEIHAMKLPDFGRRAQSTPALLGRSALVARGLAGAGERSRQEMPKAIGKRALLR